MSLTLIITERALIGCRCKHKGSWLWFPLSLDASPAGTPILYEVAEKHRRHFSYFTPEQIFTDPDWLESRRRGGFTNLQLFKTIETRTLEPAP